MRRSEQPLLYRDAEVKCTWVPSTVPGTEQAPQVVASFSLASTGEASHQPSTVAPPKSQGVEERMLESALEAENTPQSLLLLGTVLTPPRPISKWKESSRDLSPVVILSLANLCTGYRTLWMGYEGQVSILNGP